MDVLVTGGTGYTGTHLIRALLDDGHRVRALARSQPHFEDLQHDGIDIIAGDIRDAAAVDDAMFSARQVYHLAAATRPARRPDAIYREVNVTGTRNVLKAARRHGIERLIHVSTAAVHGNVGNGLADERSRFDPHTIEHQTKLEADLLVQDAVRTGVPAVIVRPSTLYGPGHSAHAGLFRAIQDGQFVMFGSGRARHHLVYIDDLIDGLRRCGASPEAIGQTYILAGPSIVTVSEMVRLVSRILGARPPTLSIPLRPMIAAAQLCELVCRPLQVAPPLSRGQLGFFHVDQAYRTDKARRELGFCPMVKPAEGLARMADSFFDQGWLRPTVTKPALAWRSAPAAAR